MRAIVRFGKIIITIFRYGLDQLIMPYYFAPSFWLVPKFWRAQNRLNDAKRLSQALEELGPIFVKFGQMLSSREDFLTPTFIAELVKLQDKVAPFESSTAVQIVEKSSGKKINEVFKDFTMEPLASASVAQVHRAVLLTGEHVVVKILRPNIHKIIASDIALMYLFATVVTALLPNTRRLNLTQVVGEFEYSTQNELDLKREASNASQIRRSFEGSDMLYVPEVYWDYSSSNILVLEEISGINIYDTKALQQADVDMKKLAEKGIEIFFSQVFRDRFFHADMHPGNLFIDITNKNNPKYIAVDFGIVGSLSENDQRYIAENFLAFFNRDYGRVAALHVDSGWVPDHIRVDQFEMDLRAVCEPIFAKPLKDICFGKLLFNLFQTARKYEMQVQPQLVLLQKTLVCIESLGRKLYPDLDLWASAKPCLESWIKERVGVKAAFMKTKQQMPYLIEKMPDIPGMIYNILEQAQSHNAVKAPSVARSSSKGGYVCGFVLGVGVSLISVYCI